MYKLCKYKNKESYYIRAYNIKMKRNTVWQIRDEGVKILRRNHTLIVGQYIKKIVFDELCQANEVFMKPPKTKNINGNLTLW